ncbi:MAG: nitroreductase family protein, partial [Candidatus Nanoarchaeia archaeon]|nr:nitroreductase family protein [Candidatus Nanoarchaeia archaeon]
MRFKNETLKTIYTRRSIRKYLPKKVPQKIITEILNAAVMAPSAVNTQPWHFSIIEGKEKVKHFAELAYEEHKLIGKLIWHGYRLTAESIFFNAPVLIIISGKKNYEWLKEDTNLAVQNMFLAAHSLGIGSCWIGFGMVLNKSKEARKELKIPNNFDISAALIFGYPAKN